MQLNEVGANIAANANVVTTKETKNCGITVRY